MNQSLKFIFYILVLENEVPALTGCRAILRRGNVNNIEVDGLDPAVTDNGN
jgi:hypothetical protein